MTPEIPLYAAPTAKERNLIKPKNLSGEIRRNFEEAGFTIYSVCPNMSELPFSELFACEKKRGGEVKLPDDSNQYTVAIETIQIPKKGEKTYGKTKIDEILGLKQRLDISPADVTKKLEQKKDDLLIELGLPAEMVSRFDIQLRFPNIFELYSLSKEKLTNGGNDEIVECTSTLFVPFEGASERHVCLGCSTERGDKNQGYYYLTTALSGYGYHNLGFRFLVAFPPI